MQLDLANHSSARSGFRKENTVRDRFARGNKGSVDNTPLWLRDEGAMRPRERAGRTISHLPWSEQKQLNQTVYGRTDDL